MKYKVGDRVKIKSNDFFNKNKGKLSFYVDSMALCFSNEIVTIKSHGRHPDTYRILEDEGDFLWSDEMFEGLAEEENNHLTETVVDAVRESNDRYRIVIDHRFDIEVDEGEYYAVRRKKEYPKTYEECCELLSLGEDGRLYTKGYKASLIQNFQKLLICRDAYWKIAGEEMGLGKPWEPCGNEDCFVISRSCGEVFLFESAGGCEPFEFPTREMRDAFKENFDTDIESCKELL